MEVDVRGNNLYRNGYIVEFADTDELLLMRDLIKYDPEEDDTYYTVKDNDRLDLIAYRQYNHLTEDSSKYWWIIADANNVQMPLDLSEFIGKQIIIPNLFKVLLAIQ